MFNRRHRDVSEAGRQLKLQGEVDKGKRDYRVKISFLESWLERAEQQIITQIRCDSQELKAHNNSLEVSRHF